jgi:hypothetical protein
MIVPGGSSSDVRSPTYTSSDVRSPTSTSSDVRSPTSTRTDARTRGNITVTGGAGRGAYTTVNVYGRLLDQANLGGVENDTWPSTGAIDTETNSLDLSIRQLAQDAFDQGLPGWTPVEQNAWNAFIADWKQWKDSGYYWNPTRRDELLGYRARFNKFLGQFGSAGVETQAEAQAAIRGPDAFDSASGLLTKALWVVGGVGLLWVGHTLYKEFRP